METNKNFAVIGLGEFGSRICEVLVDGGASVVAFDHDIQAVERIKKIVPAAMLVETTNEEALLKAPLDDVEVAIVAIGNKAKRYSLCFSACRFTSPCNRSKEGRSKRSFKYRNIGCNKNCETAYFSRCNGFNRRYKRFFDKRNYCAEIFYRKNSRFRCSKRKIQYYFDCSC